MEGLFNLREDKIDEFVPVVGREPRERVMEAVDVAVSQVPSIAGAVSRLLDRIMEDDPSYCEPILGVLLAEGGGDVAAVSRAVYRTHLGAPAALEGVDLAAEIAPVSRRLAGCRAAAPLPPVFARPRVLGDAAGGFLDVFLCYAIIRNMGFYKLECCYRLRGFSHASIIEAMLVDESLAAVSMAVELCKVPGFFAALAGHIRHFSRRAVLTSLLFVAYYRPRRGPDTGSYVCMRSEEDREALRGMFDEEAERLSVRIGSKARLNALLGTCYADPRLPVMPRADFVDGEFPTQEAFFGAFLAVSSPSVSHFFNYMELFKDRFVLDAEGQRRFLEALRAFHAENAPYLDIVVPRLVKFGVIAPELV